VLHPNRESPMPARTATTSRRSSERPHSGWRGPDSSDVLSGAPFGVLVFDEHGALLGHNPAAARLLGSQWRHSADERPLRCCDLLGCRRAASALEGRCVVELVQEADSALPEIRIDLAADQDPSALWITLAPLDGEPPRVLVTLRPGQFADRRRRTNPHWISTPRLQVSILGRTALASSETSLGGRWLRQRPGQLLKYLLVHRNQLVPLDELAETFWPDGADAALRNVRYFVHVVRNQLEPGRPRRVPSAFIVAENGGYRLDTTRIDIDAERFESLAAQGLHALRRDDPHAAAVLEEAADLYGGEFLADEPYADWALPERERLRRLVGDVLNGLAGLDVGAGELDRAAAHLTRLAELEPYDVDVHRQLVRLDIQRGHHSEAKRLYASLRARMRQSFGEELDFTLNDLAAEAAAVLRPA
jgi:DNA-binding SARP family transcriptional activator